MSVHVLYIHIYSIYLCLYTVSTSDDNAAVLLVMPASVHLAYCTLYLLASSTRTVHITLLVLPVPSIGLLLYDTVILYTAKAK